MKQYSEACERNKNVILDVLGGIFAEPGKVLEIGAGTGQHAAYFSARMPHLEWQPTDIVDNLPSINAYRRECGSENLLEARELDLGRLSAGERIYTYGVCINTVHIVSWDLVRNLWTLLESAMLPQGLVYFYGPFRYSNRDLERSNEQFDHWLKCRDPASGIRLFEDVDRLAIEHGFEFCGDQAMPANNRSLWWRRSR